MNQRQAIYLRVIIVSSIVHMNSFIKRIDQLRITFVLPLITATLVFLKLVSILVSRFIYQFQWTWNDVPSFIVRWNKSPNFCTHFYQSFRYVLYFLNSDHELLNKSFLHFMNLCWSLNGKGWFKRPTKGIG